MGLTTQYLRYESSSKFGVIGTQGSIAFITKNGEYCKHVAVPACDEVILWDIRSSKKIATLNGDVKSMVTIIQSSANSKNSDNTHIAVGYNDGALVVFKLYEEQPVKFLGHKSPISSLAWDKCGMVIASGSHDGEIFIWDLVAEKGLVKLKGHKSHITRVRFMHERNILVSSGIDSFIKFWDIDTNHCFRTLAGHRTEVLDFVFIQNDSKMITGCNDAALKIWKLEFMDDKISEKDVKNTGFMAAGDRDYSNIDEDADFANDASRLKISNIGTVLRTHSDKVIGLTCHDNIVACYGKSPVIDIFRWLSEEESALKKAKRLRKAEKKAKAKNTSVLILLMLVIQNISMPVMMNLWKEGTTLPDNVYKEHKLSDEVVKLISWKVKKKLYALDLHFDSLLRINIIILHVNNSLSKHVIPTNKKKTVQEDNIISSIFDRQGHQGEVRCICFNSAGDQLVTAGADSIKVWDRLNTQVVRTIYCDYAVSLLIVPGDRHVLIGTHSGHVHLFDLSSSELLLDQVAHDCDPDSVDSGVWSLALKSDGKGFISGGSDHMVRFWNFELIKCDSNHQQKLLSFIEGSVSLKVADQITCVCCSEDGKYLAVATLDLKETLYFTDTLKLHHELYGKSLPATCMAFSEDSSLIVTGSKDSCIRIYSTDFGDQQKLLKNAHQGGVTDLKFISKTHLFFSCGHDGTLKQWDADNFQRIITFQKHFGIARCLAICPKGAWVASAGQDHSLHLYERTNEPLILEEEREEERRREEELKNFYSLSMQNPVFPGEAVAEAVRPTSTTEHTEKVVDLLLEALNIYYLEDTKENYLMKHVYHTCDPLKFVFEVLKKIKSSDLEEAMLSLSFDRVLQLLRILCKQIKRNWDSEMLGRVLVFLLRVNLMQLTQSPEAAPILRKLSKFYFCHMKEYLDCVNFNLAGLAYMRDRIEKRNEVQLFMESNENFKKSKRKKKQKLRAAKRVLLTLK